MKIPMLITLLALFLSAYLIHMIFVAPGNLVDWQIRLYIALKLLKIDNYYKEAIQPNSLDDHFILEPGDFVLATTQEYFYFPSNIHGVLQGKSSWARLGLYVESAGLFDSGFEGEGVVELTNQGQSPLRLDAGKAIAQMIFIKNLPVQNPYGKKKYGLSNYQGQKGARQSCLESVIAKDAIKASRLSLN
jgi:deoxycytidine triphosphate deaminase